MISTHDKCPQDTYKNHVPRRGGGISLLPPPPPQHTHTQELTWTELDAPVFIGPSIYSTTGVTAGTQCSFGDSLTHVVKNRCGQIRHSRTGSVVQSNKRFS